MAPVCLLTVDKTASPEISMRLIEALDKAISEKIGDSVKATIWPMN
jgi:hypothetical protein